MTEILPLNIITPTGVKYRSYATSNATLADLRKVLIQDGIIEASAKFQVQDTVITPIGERFTKCKDVFSFPGLVGEIHMRPDGYSAPFGSICSRCCDTAVASYTKSEVELVLVPLHCFYYLSPANHLYTTSHTERDTCIKNGYGLESNAGLILASPSPAGDSIPFFRIAYTVNESAQHVYTADVPEKERSVAKAGVRDEGIVGYVYAQQRLGTLPLYRLYNHNSSDHLYTTYSDEREKCIKDGWTDEGIACYVYA